HLGCPAANGQAGSSPYAGTANCNTAQHRCWIEMKPEHEFVEVFPDPPALARAAGHRFVALAQSAVARRDKFTVALAGGSTPKGLYTLLATDPALRAGVPWSQIHFFFGDERHVPPDHAENNLRMANEAMFQR